MEKLNVLIVDDEAELRASLKSVLESNKSFEYEISEASNGREAIKKADASEWDLIIMDVKMPEIDGLEALRQIKEKSPETFVVILTAHSNLDDAITAIKHGAYDYLEKPINPEKVNELLSKAAEARRMVSSLLLSNPIMDDDIESDLVGSSSKMKEIFGLINRLCRVDTTVLVRGENGTGKELVARAIHYNSYLKDGPFVAINCGAIPENLMESELFGHEKGAFTGATERKIGKFQLANNGTIFLDEIAELRPDMQVKLLRVLQERSFIPVGSNREVKTNSRIIAATNRNLEKMIEEGRFREDLFYRLNVMPIFIPPLRERNEDINQLVQQFIDQFNEKHNRQITNITTEAFEILKNYKWPGNIRELENVIERAFIIENSNTIQVSSLPEELLSKSTPDVKVEVAPDYHGPLDFEHFKETMEKEFIIKALTINKGRINKTVAYANIPKNTLLRKIKKYGIDVKSYQ